MRLQPAPDRAEERVERARVLEHAGRVAEPDRVVGGDRVRLALEVADAEVELRRYGQVLVVLGEGADEGAVVGAQVGDVGVLAVAEGRLAVAGGCCGCEGDEGGEEDGGCEEGGNARHAGRWLVLGL